MAALAAPAMATVAVALIETPFVLLVAVLSLAVAVSTAAHALTRAGLRRAVAAALAVAGIVGPLVLLVTSGDLVPLLAVFALVGGAGTATRHALGRDLASLKSGPTPGVAVGRGARPVLFMNPEAGTAKSRGTGWSGRPVAAASPRSSWDRVTMCDGSPRRP